jgi:hypothetical protein
VNIDELKTPAEAPLDERQRLEAELEEGLEDTFPASDPPTALLRSDDRPAG